MGPTIEGGDNPFFPWRLDSWCVGSTMSFYPVTMGAPECSVSCFGSSAL